METVHAILCHNRWGRNLHCGRACFVFIESLLGPEAESPPAQLVGLAGHPPHLGAAPVEGELAEAVDEALLLHHGQVALAALLLAAVVVTHRPRHLKHFPGLHKGGRRILAILRPHSSLTQQ